MKKLEKERLPREASPEEEKAYEEAIARFHEREKEYSNWSMESYSNVHWHNATTEERKYIIRAFNYILKRYDKKLEFGNFMKAMMLPWTYDIRK